MMKKSAFGFCDFSWNPVTGCLMDCPHCFAMSHLRRFAGDIRINKGSEQLIKEAPGLYILPKPFKSTYGTILQSPVGTTPTLHEYRLPMVAQKKKPAVIIVCSYADLFGAWVPDEWIRCVFDACEAAPWHKYLFLTKNPQRFIELDEKGLLPAKENYWYGTSITDTTTSPFVSDAHNCFLSIDPLIAPLGNDSAIPPAIKWVLIGAETSNRRGKVAPKREWIKTVVTICKKNKTPLFMKTSQELSTAWTKDIVQEFPEGLKQPPQIPVPHCRECKYNIIKPDGRRGLQRFCQIGDGKGGTPPQHIEGRYARTCPPWCRRRSGEISVGQIWEQDLLQNQKKGVIMNNTDKSERAKSAKINGR